MLVIARTTTFLQSAKTLIQKGVQKAVSIASTLLAIAFSLLSGLCFSLA